MNAPGFCVDPSLIPQLHLFRNVPMELIETYLKAAKKIDIKAGDILLQPERENQNIYSLIKGRLEVHLNSITHPPFTSIEPGECVGEMSIIDRKRPSAYIIASEDSTLLAIDHDTLWAMVYVSHAVSRNLLYILSGRVRFDNVLLADSLETQRRFQHYAMVDELTGLHNRRWMNEMFAREIRRCALDDEKLCLAMMDIDHFKKFNDQYGHLAGDRALAEMANELRRHLRPNDMLARYGGEEFAVLFPQTDRPGAANIAERLRKNLAELSLGHYKSQQLPFVTVSIGIAEIKPNDTLDELVSRADAALYRAKERGRDCVSL